MIPVDALNNPGDLVVDILCFPSCVREQFTASLDSRTSTHLYFHAPLPVDLFVSANTSITLRIEVLPTSAATMYPTFSVVHQIPVNTTQQATTLRLSPTGTCSFEAAFKPLPSAAVREVTHGTSETFRAARTGAHTELALRIGGHRLGKVQLWRGVQLCRVMDVWRDEYVGAEADEGRIVARTHPRVLVIGDVSLGDDTQTVDIHSGVQLRSELREEVSLYFQQLFLCEQPRLINEVDTLAFDNDPLTTWKSPVGEDRRAVLEFVYTTPRDIAVYAVTSDAAVAQTVSWNLEVLEPNGLWKTIDRRDEVVMRGLVEHHVYSCNDCPLGTDFRFVFEVTGKRRQRESVSVKSVHLLASQLEKNGEVCIAPFTEATLRPGESVYVPVNILVQNGALKVGKSGSLLVFDLLGIPTSAPDRWMDFDYFIDQDAIHHSLRYDQGKACVLTTSFMRSKLNTVQWVVTLASPLLVNNLLPWPVECSWGTRRDNDKPFMQTGEALSVRSGATATATSLRSNNGSFEWLGHGDIEEIRLRLAIPQKEIKMGPEDDLLLLSSTSIPSTVVKRDLALFTTDGQLIQVQVELTPSVTVHADTNIAEVETEINGQEPVQEDAYNSDDSDLDGNEVVVKSRDPLTQPLLKGVGQNVKEIHYSLQRLAKSWQVRLYCRFCCLNLSGLPLIFAEKPRRKTAEDEASGKQADEPQLVPFTSNSAKMYVSLRDQHSAWSQRFGLVAGVKGTVNLAAGSADSKKNNKVYQLGVTISPAPGLFWRTSIIRFFPQFIVQNNCSSSVTLVQKGCDKILGLTLQPEAVLPFHPGKSQIGYHDSNQIKGLLNS